MIVHSPRMIAGLAMLSLGFFDGILGVAWLSIHDDLGVSPGIARLGCWALWVLVRYLGLRCFQQSSAASLI